MKKVYDKKIKKWVLVINEKCLEYKCYHPHDCPIQGANGVRATQERYMCLTNFYNGCPEKPSLN